MLRLSLATAAIGLALLAHAGPASAQDGTKKESPDFAKAKVHYAAAETAAGEGRWEDAARDYGIAYEITKDAVLFFKLGNAYDKLGNCKTALVYYRRYVAEGSPEKEFLDLTNDKIAACEAKVGTDTTGTDATGTGTDATGTGTDATGTGTDATGTGTDATGTGTDATGTGTGADATGTDTGTTTTDTAAGTGDGTADPFADDDGPNVGTDPLVDPATEGQPTWQRTAAWISIGVGVAFGVTGSVLGLAASSREDDINADIDFRDGSTGLPARFQGTAAERYNDLVDQGEKLELAALLSFGAAGAAVAAAAVFFAIDPGPTRRSSGVTVAPALAPDMLGVSAGWSFE